MGVGVSLRKWGQALLNGAHDRTGLGAMGTNWNTGSSVRKQGKYSFP